MDIMDRFSDRIIPEPNSGCWIWTGHITRDGYGRFRARSPRRMVLAHRYSLICSGHDVPADKQVMHRCDTPSCVNPGHLFVGTQKDNMADCARKKRFPSRSLEKNSMAKLTREQFAEALSVRGRLRRGQLEAMARKFNVSAATISSLRWRRGV